VNGDGPGSAPFGHGRDFRRVSRCVVPAKPHLYSHWNLDRIDRCSDEALGKFGLAHEGGACDRPCGHFPGRTAEIEVNDFCPCRSGQTRACSHGGGISAYQLDNHQGQSFTDRSATHNIRPATG
jgi:hypothetical protein